MVDLDTIETFQAVTGADSSTARYVLEAHGGNLNDSVNFFVESAGMVPAKAATESDTGPSNQGYQQNYPSNTVESGPAGGAGGQHSTPVEDLTHHVEDPALEAALQASLHTGGSGSPITAMVDDTLQAQKGEGPDVDNVDDSGDNDFGDLDYHQDSLGRQSKPYSRQVSRQSAALQGLVSGLFSENGSTMRTRSRSWRQLEDSEADEPTEMDGASGSGRAARDFGLGLGPLESVQPPFFAGPTGSLNGHFDFPAGINVEEARMLEAAMLGVPYDGHMPDFQEPGHRDAPAEPPSPSVMYQRQLREEQDLAYQESLQADRMKADAALAAQQAEVVEEERKQQEERLAELAQEASVREASKKQARLPEEPEPDAPAAVNVMIRFATTDSMSSLFDFVDVSAAPEIKPGTYKLVTRFPRRVFTSDMTASLEEAGLSQKQEAVFVELS